MYKHWEQAIWKIDPGAKLLRAWELKGGVSAQVTALQIEKSDGSLAKLVVRQHGKADRSRNPYIARDEFLLLQALKEAGLPASAPYVVYDSEDSDYTPFIVTNFVEGISNISLTDVPNAMTQLAAVLTDIHHVDREERSLHFLPQQIDLCSAKLEKRPEQMDNSLSEGRIRIVLESVWPLPQMNRDVLLHGDFWPGNIMWKDGCIAAVIDWEDAAQGDPLYDLANSRLEMLWAYGVAAMLQFTYQYQLRNSDLDFTKLSYWDLYAVLKPASSLSDWGLEADTERQMREKHRWFTDQAFAQIHPS
ncbi:phosphotransferase [Paenibacillus sp.]|jgi:aminoglycoside phosphotransferase (APT) family kinase protein|uniref:phosphotransferase family protein n=1 Tax=Paenibacillus sp. TaxID=58172 RepID=UPI00281724EC|nr:phosphotransferase [Paenibacillus sp.]MDR0270654.1 phosphotransferase [Paenibacillus sp.]